MEHSFNTNVAKVYGVDGAIILHNIRFWILKNKANEKHLYENRYWTYNSIKAFTILFPYWTHRQIERIINNLVEQKALIKGNFNQNKYDQTKWYAISDCVNSIYANGEIEISKPLNEIPQTVEPIPDNNTYNNTDGKQNNSENENFEEILNPKSFPNWRQECRNFLRDDYFKKTFCREHKIPMGNLEELMINFVKKLNLENDFKNVAAIKRHFVNHYKKHSQGINSYTAFTGSKGYIEIPENQNFDDIGDRWDVID